MNKRWFDAVTLLLLQGNDAVAYMYNDNYSDVDAAPLADPRTLSDGYVTLGTPSKMSTNGTLLTTDESIGAPAYGGTAYSKNDGAPTTLADGMLFGFDALTLASTSIGRGFRTTATFTGTYSDLALSVDGALTLQSGGDFYNFASSVFAAGIPLAYWFDNGLCYVFTYASSVWELQLIIPAITGNHYALTQTALNLGSGTTTVKRNAGREALTDVIGGVPMASVDGTVADAPSSDFSAKMVLTTIGSQSFIFFFRIQDSLNYWQLLINPAGAFALFEVVAGTATSQANDAGAVNGSHIVVKCKGDTIDIWVDSTRITYALATNFSGERGCELERIGTGGVVDDILLHGLNPTGAALIALNSVKAA